MEFLLKRTSAWDGKPCKEGISKELVRIDRRTVKTLAEAKLPKHKHWADGFFASGTNHREELGMIARDLEPRKKWIIKINTLEDLIKLNKKYGDLIISQENEYKGIDYSIEIYDDYRE